jgi:hypothetical protein
VDGACHFENRRSEPEHLVTFAGAGQRRADTGRIFRDRAQTAQPTPRVAWISKPPRPEPYPQHLVSGGQASAVPPLLPPPASHGRRRPCGSLRWAQAKKAPAELRAWAGAHRIGDAMHVGQLRRRHLDFSRLTKSKCWRRSGSTAWDTSEQHPTRAYVEGSKSLHKRGQLLQRC